MPIARIAAWLAWRWSNRARCCAGFCIFAVFWSGLAKTSDCADDAPPPAAPECQHAEFLLAGLRDARLRLRSGVFEGKGHVVKFGGATGPVEGEVTMFCAFDYDRGLMRMDRAEPQLFIDADTNQRDVRLVKTKIAKTLQRTVSWDNAWGIDEVSHFVSIYTPEWQPDTHALPVDVRTFGLAGWQSVEKVQGFSNVLDILSAYQLTDVHAASQNSCVATFLVGAGGVMQATIWFDHTHGFTPTREEFRGRGSASNAWSDVDTRCEVQWEEISDIWVPKSLVLHRRFNGDETYSVNLKWRSVNQPIPPELFEPDGLGVEKGTPILDCRLGGKPIALGRVGELGKQPYSTKRPQPKHPPRGLFLIVNTMLVALAAGFWWYRRRRRVAARTATSSESASPDSEDTKRMSPRRPDLE